MSNSHKSDYGKFYFEVKDWKKVCFQMLQQFGKMMQCISFINVY